MDLASWFYRAVAPSLSLTARILLMAERSMSPIILWMWVALAMCVPLLFQAIMKYELSNAGV